MTKEINGFLYSKEQLSNYKLRLIVRIYDTDGFEHTMDVYTDCDDDEEITRAIDSSVTEKVVQWEITHKATKEQDDLNSKFIDEWLKDI